MTERHYYAIFMLLAFGAWQEYVVPIFMAEDSNLLLLAAAWSSGIAIAALLCARSDR